MTAVIETGTGIATTDATGTEDPMEIILDGTGKLEDTTEDGDIHRNARRDLMCMLWMAHDGAWPLLLLRGTNFHTHCIHDQCRTRSFTSLEE